MDWTPFILLVVGICFAVYGLALLLKPDFEKKEQEKMQKDGYNIFPAEDNRIYSKTTRALRALIPGLMMIVFAIYLFLSQ
ncbi:MAG: hypothetical protein AAB407_03385 [Patescibacteria group bacterium]